VDHRIRSLEWMAFRWRETPHRIPSQ
jgi:hypothetical protein